MQRSLRLHALALCAAGFSFGGNCTPSPNGPDFCDAPAATRDGNTVALVIGDDLDGPFEAWTDGSPTDVLLGAQGGYMVTPTVCLRGPGVPSDTTCLNVEIANTVEGGDGSFVPASYSSSLEFESTSNGLCAERILNFLTYSSDGLDGTRLRLDVTVDGHGLTGSGRVTVLLKLGS